MPGAFRPFAWRLIATGAWCSANGQAATIVAIGPQGEGAPVRQVCIRFSEAVVLFGELQPPDPMHVTCRGAAPAGTGRCADDRVWLHDFRAAMWAGVRCRLTPRAERKPIGTAGDATKPAAGESSTPAALTGTTEFNFGTAGPAIVSMQPHDGGQFAQAGSFLLRLSGAAVEATELANTWCEVEGIGERFGMRVIGGDAREQLLKSRRIEKPQAERSLEFRVTDIPADTNARARLRTERPARHTQFRGREERHQQGHVRQRVHRVHRPPHRRRVGRQCRWCGDAA